jgi:hypothetical protein
VAWERSDDAPAAAWIEQSKGVLAAGPVYRREMHGMFDNADVVA